MNSDDRFCPPQPTDGDLFHTGARVGLSAIPFIGGPAVEFFNSLITPPIERRRSNWMKDVARAISELESKHANLISRLQQSEAFQSLLLQATWAAVRNHQQEKLTALRNAVINSANGTVTSEDLQLLFVRYVDELTPSHLIVMQFFVQMEKEVAHAKCYEDLYAMVPDTLQRQVDKVFFKLICDDLKARSLVRITDQFDDFPGLYNEVLLATSEGDTSAPRIRVTQIGHGFVEFVTKNPLHLE